MNTEKTEETILSGQASQEQIAMWEKEHIDVFEVKVRDKVCYLKRPSRLTLKAVDAIADKDGDKSNEILLENCWLGGDPEIKAVDLYFLEVVPALEQVLDFGRAEIKKL
jgi:hypothetical protein